ncbi:hypothetical protein J6590_065618 [Homalodisca vitripennis]|nr:hypothetical protein J6590_065618 [Homalodisca vitripennis]
MYPSWRTLIAFLIASGKENITQLLAVVYEILECVNLKSNARSCSTLDIDRTDRQRVLTPEYDIDVALMVWQRKSEGYCHLGVPTGTKINKTSE